MSDENALAVLREVEQAWNHAMRSWDVDRLVELFDEDAQFFGSLPTLYTGRDGVRAYFAQFPASGCTADFRSEVATRVGDVVVGSGFITFHLAIGDAVKALPFRFSFGLVERGHGWQILLHHTSPYSG